MKLDLRNSRLAMAVAVGGSVIAAGCGSDTIIVDRLQLDPGETVTAIEILPRTAAVEPGGTVQFATIGLSSDGDTVLVFPTYAATGGTVSLGGNYTAGQVEGEFEVTATDGETGLQSTAIVTISATPIEVVDFFVAPQSIQISTGQSFTFLAFGVTSAGDTTGVTATWSATGGVVSSSGVFTAGAQPGPGRVIGVFDVTFADTATVQISTPSGSSGTPDPTLLPIATVDHDPLAAAYDALNIPGLAVGEAYNDPTTGVQIYRITDGSFPTNSANWGHDYSEGGNEVSLPHTDDTRSLIVRQNGGAYWLVDFTPQQGPLPGSVGAIIDNARMIPFDFGPANETAFTFSSNAATPYYAFIASGSEVLRFDIRTMQKAPGDGWPIATTANTWVHQSMNDELFTWLTAEGVAQGYQPSTGTLLSYTGPNSGTVNEPRIDRAGRYIGLVMDNPNSAIFVWDFDNDELAWSGSGVPPFGHNASLRRLWVGIDVFGSYPPDYTWWRPDVPDVEEYRGGPANASAFYGNGNWNQPDAEILDQWALMSNYGGVTPVSGDWGWLAPGGMIYITYNGERRLLGHPYSSLDVYTFYSFVKQSPDGLYVQFTSDMNASGRSDIFLVEVPTR